MGDIRIVGIDASLSSTGFAVADVNVDPKIFDKHKKNLFKMLTTKLGDKIDASVRKSFEECFTLIKPQLTEIKEDKDTIKELTAVRKRIREAKILPSIKDLVKEEKLEVKRITDQVNNIMERIRKLHEDPEKTFIFIEDYSYHSPGSLTQLAEMKGLLRVEMEKFIAPITKEDLDIQSYFYITANINTVKKVASLNGNADKNLICEQLARFGYECNVKEDDAADAIGVCLAGFYTIYHILNKFEMPECKTAKDKNFYKSFIQSLDTFAARIGSEKELYELLRVW